VARAQKAGGVGEDAHHLGPAVDLGVQPLDGVGAGDGAPVVGREGHVGGFDSFEGLPESFDERAGLLRAAFDVNGQLPLVDDPRVTFHKGWFADTLSKFNMPPHDQLVITLDADLYSSTRTVLEHLDRWIVPGTFIYFDDFAHMEHEPKAFGEYLQDTGKRFKLAATVTGLNCSVFVCCP
jgi:hypothetical protein